MKTLIKKLIKYLANFTNLVILEEDVFKKYALSTKIRAQLKRKDISLKDSKQKIQTLTKKCTEFEKEVKIFQDIFPEENPTKHKNWAARVKKGQVCDICESKEKLTAHHLWDKKNHPSLRYQDENGVCLCLECHNGFHKLYTNKSHVTPAMYKKYRTQKMTHITMGWVD